MKEAPLADTGYGLVWQEEGWFVLNARDGRRRSTGGGDAGIGFSGPGRLFDQVGVGIDMRHTYLTPEGHREGRADRGAYEHDETAARVRRVPRGAHRRLERRVRRLAGRHAFATATAGSRGRP